MPFGLVLLPIFMALVALALPSNRWRPWLLPLTGLLHLALTALALARPALGAASEWLVLDPAGRVILGLVSVLFLACSIHAVGYLHLRAQRVNRVFCACLLALLGMMSLVTWAHHLALLWVAVEATTLATAPLLYFNRTARSIEATWKYLMVGSVGIGVALLGTFFLAYASLEPGLGSSLVLEDLLKVAPQLSKPWLHASFVLLLVGYGTKMGLAPMHTWKPDAYGEAPGVVGALMAGGVTSCAFLAILRIYQITYAAEGNAFCGKMLILMGLLSMGAAAVFMIGQRDFKRMLAYSSIEHMGILILGIGVGGPATFGSLLHVVNNGLTKGVLFLAAGNIHRAYDSKTTDQVSGALSRLPLSAALFLAAFLAVTGSPPFAPFLSEFTILSGTLGQGRFLVGGLFLLFLLCVFIGMGATVLRVVLGAPSAEAKATPYRDGLFTGLPLLALMAVVLLLGLYLPPPLRDLVDRAARFLVNQP